MLFLLIILMVIVPLVVLLVMGEVNQRHEFRRRNKCCSVALQTVGYREKFYWYIENPEGIKLGQRFSLIMVESLVGEYPMV